MQETIEQYFDKYNYGIFSEVDGGAHIQLKAPVTEGYNILEEDNVFIVEEILERGRKVAKYKSKMYEQCLIYIASIIKDDNRSEYFTKIRSVYKKENGYAIDNSKNTLQRTYEFLNRNNLREYYSTEENIKPMTRVVIEENNKYNMYKIDENLNKVFIISFEKGDASVFRSLVNKTIEKKYLIDFEKEMYEIFNIEAHDIPKEIKENIYK